MKEEIWRTINRVLEEDFSVMENGFGYAYIKKGECENYTWVTVMPVAFRVHAEVVKKRVEESVEEIEYISHNQAGFKKGLGTIDNILCNKCNRIKKMSD